MPHFFLSTAYRTFFVLLAAAAAVAWSACGGHTEQRPDYVPPPGNVNAPAPADAEPTNTKTEASGGLQVVAKVGPAGAVLRLSQGASVEIPPNTVTQTTEVKFSVGETSQTLNVGGRRLVSRVFQLEPALQAPEGAFIVVESPYVTVPSGFTEDDLAFAVESPEKNRVSDMGAVRTEWQNNPVTKQSGRLSAQLSVLPGMRFAFVVTH